MSRAVLASKVLCHSGVATLLRRGAGHRGFVVLNYHRIGHACESPYDRDVFSSTPEELDRHVSFLKRECDVILPADIPELSQRGRGNYAMITFDDGYQDNYRCALPVLRSHGVKAVFFIATGFIDRPHLSWWDEIAWMVRTSRRTSIGPTVMLRESLALSGDRTSAVNTLLNIYKHLPNEATALFLDEVADAAGTGRAPAELGREVWMNWDMIREMASAGMVIGGHTVNHPILANLKRFDQELEIVGCAGSIYRHLGAAMEVFSYPRGKPDSYTAETRAILGEAHVKYAFSYYGGMNFSERLDPLDVRRVAVEKETPLEQFQAMVSLPRVFA